MLKELIIQVIDFFYPPFRRFMPLQTFRYAACGGGNALLDIVLYYISFHYVLHEQVLQTPAGAISAHIAAFLCAFIITFPIGFFLNRLIVFPDSTLRGRVQLMRYFMLVTVCIGLNYVFIKLFVEQFHIYPTVAKILTAIIVIAFSFLSQKHFSFKTASQAEVIRD